MRFKVATSTWATAVLFVLGGMVCLAAGINNYIGEEKFFTTAEHATAHIIEYRPDRDPKAADFCPEYEFTTAAGETITYAGDDCPSQPDKTKIGQTEEVYFDPEDPQIVESRGWLGSEGSGLILGLIGCVFFPGVGMISVAAALFQNRRKAARWQARTLNGTTTDDAKQRLAELQRQEAELKRQINSGRKPPSS